MRSRSKLFRAFGVLTLMGALAVLAVGCGGGGKKSSSGSTNGNAGNSSGKTYPVLNVVWDAPDYMDPGLYYTVAAYQLTNYVWTGLVGYKHTSGPASAELVPYLAESMPTVSADAKTYTFTLRQNLKYSNGKPVKASDFRYSIERDFKIDSPGVGFYADISGVSGPSGFATTKKGHISGIVTDDASRKITIHLDNPRGDFLYILALEFSHFVPAGTPASDQSTKAIPATGPYMIQSYVPSRSFVLVRNPNYNNQIPTMPSGNPDKVVGKIITDPVAAYQQVVSNKADYDYQIVPNDRLPEAQSKYKDQLRLYTNANTYYYALNNAIPPFNNIKARKAAQQAIDPNAIISGIYGGLGRPTQNFLPPGYPQYKKIDAWKFDIAAAKKLVQQSGTAGASVDVYGPNEDPSKASTEYLANQLSKIGYKTKLHLLSHQVYFQTIGNQATKAQAMFTDWYQDYPHPLDWFDVLLSGERITKTHNNNVGNVKVPSVDKEIDALKKEANVTAAVNDRWAKVDRDLMATYATTIPYMNRSSTDFFSNKMDMSCYTFSVVLYWDWGLSCKK
ncbi:MAG: peptide/nickel transport system substrate-binding protein [Gaiellaceae bacterium]|nr:peptide/nickel transport system substrate-binding protein [Gaiellaceae bacterium]